MADDSLLHKPAAEASGDLQPTGRIFLVSQLLSQVRNLSIHEGMEVQPSGLAALVQTDPPPADLPDTVSEPPYRLPSNPGSGVSGSFVHGGFDLRVRRQALHL